MIEGGRHGAWLLDPVNEIRKLVRVPSTSPDINPGQDKSYGRGLFRSWGMARPDCGFLAVSAFAEMRFSLGK